MPWDQLAEVGARVSSVVTRSLTTSEIGNITQNSCDASFPGSRGAQGSGGLVLKRTG